jgi:hypothetical protein
MTPLRPPRSGAGEGPDEAEGGTGAGSGEGAGLPAGSPWGAELAPDGRRLRLRLVAPTARSGLANEAGGAAIAGVSGKGPLTAGAGRRLPRRLRGATPGAAGTGSWRRRSLVATCRLTLAPTSPSAHRAPSAVWTSTRHTTIEVGAPPTGGRFWVSVQRA